LILSIFHLSPAVLQATPRLAARLRYMGVKHVEMHVYGNHELESDLEWCVKNDWRVVGRMDGAIRTPAEQQAMTREKVQRSAREVVQSGVCDRVEVCDEMNPDPRVYPNLRNLADWWYGAGGPSLGFPSYSTQKYSRMPGLAGHHSCQWNWETAFTYEERHTRMAASTSGVPKDDRRVTMFIPVVKQYLKGAPDGTGEFRPGVDRWLNRGMTAKGIENLMHDAVNLVGRERVNLRVYALHTFWARDNAAAKEDARCQVGIRQSDPRWLDFELAVRGVLN
jgi:hypothetical protein